MKSLLTITTLVFTLMFSSSSLAGDFYLDKRVIGQSEFVKKINGFGIDRCVYPTKFSPLLWNSGVRW